MYIGIDLGGTNIAVGLVDEKLQILAKASLPTDPERGYKAIVKDMAALCQQVAREAGKTMDDVVSIGIGSPGSIESENGVVAYANNLNMHHVPMAEELKTYFDKPVRIENDANAAAYGEYIVNGGKVKDFVFITLGTGVGGGIIIDKKIYSGFNGAGGELGHMTLVQGGEMCTCGNPGCWEAYASVTALIRQTKEAMDQNPQSIMHKIAAEQGKVNGRTAFDAAKQGDAAGKAVVDQYIIYVAAGILSMINIFQPEELVIGGGISKEGDYLLNPIREYVEKYGYNRYLKKTELKIAKLFNDAGIIGAAMAGKAFAK